MPINDIEELHVTSPFMTTSFPRIPPNLRFSGVMTISPPLNSYGITVSTKVISLVDASSIFNLIPFMFRILSAPVPFAVIKKSELPPITELDIISPPTVNAPLSKSLLPVKYMTSNFPSTFSSPPLFI